jgi:anti-anti-sigma factor
MGRYALLQKLGGELLLENPNERVSKIFELAGLGRIIKIKKGEEDEIK